MVKIVHVFWCCTNKSLSMKLIKPGKRWSSDIFGHGCQCGFVIHLTIDCVAWFYWKTTEFY
jgi:hypothetical protein